MSFIDEHIFCPCWPLAPEFRSRIIDHIPQGDVHNGFFRFIRGSAQHQDLIAR